MNILSRSEEADYAGRTIFLYAVKEFAPTGNRTRGRRMATIYFTTKPPVLVVIVF